VTPAFKATMANHWWTFEELVELIDKPAEHQSADKELRAIPLSQLPKRPGQSNAEKRVES
jgi:hypothetical protein